ncbi:carbon-nitrogen hydrolase family protein [Actinoplanes sp. NPDC051513]|uniref:carbon-nitrogen hydrolase family protein n=1 Tax=Actinoplanes sp. NPDC051513 TaxID=3363908 RepID=UPI00379E8C0E
MRIGACQTPEILRDVDASLGVIREFAERADAEGVDLLLFPECFLQGYLVTEQHVREQAWELGSTRLTELAGIRPMLVLGMIERDGDRYFNTAVVVHDGRVAGRYRKTFLTAGESVFTAGDEYPVFECGGVRFGINICFDTRFPEAAGGVAANGGQVLLVPAQNMMPRVKALYWQERHNAIRAERARETGMWLASADVTGERDDERVGLGPTGFLSPAGEVVAQVPAGTSGMVVADVQP